MIKKLLIFIMLLFLIPIMVNAYEVKVDWQKSWGGNKADSFENILQTTDGGLVAYGSFKSTDIEGLPNKGEQDAIIAKYDKDGNLLWQKSWGGNKADSFSDILQITEGGFVAVGSSYSTDIDGLLNKGIYGSNDAIIVKYDKDGNMLWQKSWGGNRDDYFYDIIHTTDGGFVAVGSYYSTDIDGLLNKGAGDAIIVKYDKDGNMLWQKSLGGNKADSFSDILQTTDGNFIVNAYFYSTDIEGLPNKGYDDTIIVKYDKDGNMLWQKSWGGNNSDSFSDILQTIDGGFVAVGSSESTDIDGLLNKGSYDAIMVKYDKDGNMLWQKSWGGNKADSFSDILQTIDGNFVVNAYFYSTDIEGLPNKSSYGYDALIVKYDKDGNMLWQKSWGGNKNDSFENILQTTDGGLVAYGSSKSTDIEGLPNNFYYNDAIIVKYDKDGNMLWQKSWGGNNNDSFENILQTIDGGLVAYGSFKSTDIEGLSNKGEQDVIIVKYSINYDLKTNESENGTYTVTQQGKYGVITPTPNEGYEVDKIIVKDNDGNVLDVEVTNQEDGSYSFPLNDDVTVEVSFARVFRIDIKNYVNGKADIVKSDDNIVVIAPIADKGYVVDKIVVKDSAGNEIVVTKLEDEKYSFTLTDDVSVEVLFKEEIVNPKTGIINFITIIFVGFVVSFIGFIFVRNNCYRYEL